jgi:hypothetical protein
LRTPNLRRSHVIDRLHSFVSSPKVPARVNFISIGVRCSGVRDRCDRFCSSSPATLRDDSFRSCCLRTLSIKFSFDVICHVLSVLPLPLQQGWHSRSHALTSKLLCVRTLARTKIFDIHYFRSLGIHLSSPSSRQQCACVWPEFACTPPPYWRLSRPRSLWTNELL